MTRICPDCDLPLGPLAKRCSCGWKAPADAPAPQTGGPAGDPEHGRCATEILSKRCPNVGTWSATPTGKRYCSACRDGLRTIDAAALKAPPEVFEKLRNMLARAPGPRRIGAPAEPATLLPKGSLRDCLIGPRDDDAEAWGEGRE